MPLRKIRNALISVSDRTGILDLTRALIANGVDIIASDGTAKFLNENSLPVKSVSEITGSPELLSGKVKTLHPEIHAAILANRDDPTEMSELNLCPAIDAVIVNLYPAPGFDIGGPALIRAAAKNSEFVSVITHPRQYSSFVECLPTGTSREQRNQWAHEALILTAEYDLALAANSGTSLRYGENSHQSATLLTRFASHGVAGARVIQGKEMSLNNYQDADAAWLIAQEHPGSAVIIKHGIPTGVALGESAHAAYKSALESDPISAFGGVVAVNHEVDATCAAAIIENFTEVVVAQSFTQQALDTFASKPNLRIVAISHDSEQSLDVISINGGYLLQTSDSVVASADQPENWTLVAGPQVSAETLADLHFAWKVVARSRSNAIVIANSGATIGIGAGNVNRLDAALAAVTNALKHQPTKVRGSVAASDAFFPFPDALSVLIDAGITAVVQPGGSIKDDLVIAAAQSAGISLYLTGIRHFSH